MSATTVFYLVLINWIVTTILTESTLFLAFRQWFVVRTWYVTCRGERHRCGGTKVFLWPEDATEEEASVEPYHWGPWLKPAQLVTCQLCMRVWVGFAEAAVIGGPFGRWFVPANGLLFAAGGHLILELRSKIALDKGADRLGL